MDQGVAGDATRQPNADTSSGGLTRGLEFQQIGIALAGATDENGRVGITQILAVLATHVQPPDVPVWKVEGGQVLVTWGVSPPAGEKPTRAHLEVVDGGKREAEDPGRKAGAEPSGSGEDGAG